MPYNTSVNKGILEVGIPSQQLRMQESRISDVPVQRDVQVVALREVLELDGLEMRGHGGWGSETR